MFKQDGRCSKIIPKTYVFVCFLDIRSCQPKQTRDMQRIQKSSKTTSKISDVFIEITCIFDHFWHRFPSPKFWRLGEGLGLDFGFDFRPCWVQNDVRTASKNHHEKRCQHEPNMSPNMTPRGLPKSATWIGVTVGVSVQDRLLTALMPNKPSWTPSWHHVGPFFDRFWTVVGPVSYTHLTLTTT